MRDKIALPVYGRSESITPFLISNRGIVYINCKYADFGNKKLRKYEL